jgi:hypothetical protein
MGTDKFATALRRADIDSAGLTVSRDHLLNGSRFIAIWGADHWGQTAEVD